MDEILLEDFKIAVKPDNVYEDANGIFSCIYRGVKIAKISEAVGRSNICLKVFKDKYKENLDDFWWGFDHPEKGSPLKESVHIENIYSHGNLAPRVYKIVTVVVEGEKHWALIVDDVGRFVDTPGFKQPDYFKNTIRTFAENYNITVMDDGREPNLINGKYVDFQGFHLPKDYEEKLKERIRGVASLGRWGPWQNYQEVLGLASGRKNKHRIEKMNLDKLNFKGKTVLDIGCSEGTFCHYAENRGAKKVVGIDLPKVSENLWELASYLGFYNCDFFGYDLKKDIPDLGQFDIVLFLSMGTHIGLPDWVLKSVKGVLVYEGNSRDSDIEQIKTIEKEMDVVYDNFTEDLFKRRIIWAQKR